MFDNLKQTMSNDPLLTFLDVTKPFKVQIDASNFVLDGVLLQ